jgi:hypothetical protein
MPHAVCSCPMHQPSVSATVRASRALNLLTGSGAVHAHGRMTPRARISAPQSTAGRATLLAAGVLLGCGTRGADAPPRHDQAGGGSECPGHVRAANPLPGVQPAEATLAYWLNRYSPRQLDAELMSTDEVAAYNQRVGRRLGRDAYSQHDLRVPADPLELTNDVRERLSQLRPEVSTGKLVNRSGRALSEQERAAFSEAPKLETPSLRVVLEPSLLRCGPYADGLYKAEIQLAYDRNACGTLTAQSVIELLGKTSSGMWLVRSPYSLGFLPANTPLAPPIPTQYQSALLAGPRLMASRDLQLAANSGDSVSLAKHTALPQFRRNELIVASARGYERLPQANGLVTQARPLTRRAVLEAAFDTLGKPYGLGGAQGGFDCSGLLLDLFEGFDVALPRFSGWQAETGTYTVDVHGAAAAEKLRRLDLAAQSGIVLIHFPGHIMLYLGRSASGAPMAIHALGEYLQPCEAGETVVDVQRVVVSSLDLGRNTSRTSFLERMTRLVVFGGKPAPELEAFSTTGPSEPPLSPRADETCQDSEDTRVFLSPLAPQTSEPVRVVVTSTTAASNATLRIFDADGDAVPIDEFGLGGPPYARVARAARLRAGQYSAVFGSGPQKLACKRFRVRDNAVPKATAKEGDPVWEPRARWQRDSEALFAVFVEQLFTGPPDDEQTWTNLHSLLRDPNRNLLYNHLGLDEDARLEIEPDCADLPYSLRAYFAWKLRLPYAYRNCSRGRTGQPPNCGEMRSSLSPRKVSDDVAAFSEFVNRSVRAGVHSATGRTHPADSDTDLYPVALERAALPPGTVYADPYGHVMMISKWFAQGSVPGDPYGVLIAAEAQPDGTIGRRRFWQGSFLFDPDTTSVGAGFKRFRPLQYDRSTQEQTALDNAALENNREFARFSQQQYTGSRDDFYDRMDTLINPTPLAPSESMQSLIDALDEAARRRVLSVDNGEHYAKEHPQQVIAMPQGHEVFETSGAWEDFATPSRDMRLLIAIDTVTGLPNRIQQKPERFALPAGTSPAAAAQQLREALDHELRAHAFQYTRSDGSAQTLNLAEVVSRAPALELAYNPNDCAEVRWGAPAGSPERASCTRTAPAAQQTRMQSYRSWFHTRTRPARGE